MKTLLQSLIEADKICQQANVHFEKETDLRQNAAALLEKRKKAAKHWIIGGLIYMAMLPSMLGAIPFSQVLNGILGLPLVIFGYFKDQSMLKTKAKRLEQQAQTENEAGIQILEENSDSLSFLPDDYWYPLATGYLIKVIKSGRTDSLPVALDLFDAQLYRWKVEQANAEVVAQQQAQTAHLKSIRTSNKVSAAANVTNTMFNIAKEFC